jgi:isopentenyl phosphate kinase
MIVFVKLGGSLITVKDQPRQLRPEVLTRLLEEISAARVARPGLKLLLGHGSGSFGHVEARKYGTQRGVHTPEAWRGFAEVQAAAAELNHRVVAAARAAGLPVFNLPPSASVLCREGAIQAMALEPVRTALNHDLVPLVYGDVAVDAERGGTIVSTEDIFAFLARTLCPARLLLAAIEPGVLIRWPGGAVVPVITPDTPLGSVGGSHAADVTGGMASKVSQMLALAAALPELEIRIFSGMEPGLLRAVLLQEAEPGTLIRAR